jgi:hypothetical protein
MNIFYCLKRVRGNEPISFEGQELYPEIQEEVAAHMHDLEEVVQLATPALAERDAGSFIELVKIES